MPENDTNDQTPHEDSNQPIAQASDDAPSKNRSIKILSIIIAVLLAVIIGVVMFFLSKDSSTQPDRESREQSAELGSGATAKKQNTQAIQTVRAGKYHDLNLDSVTSQSNNLILNFSYIGTTESFITGVSNPLYEGKLKDAYVVDDATNQKFEVVIDDNGEPLTSDLDQEERLGRTEKGEIAESFFITFTAPPAGSTISIFIPGAQAFTDIKLD